VRCGRGGRSFLCLLLALLTAGAAAGLGPPAGAAQRVKAPRLLVGAYYYNWWPGNLAQGTLRQHLVPAQAPPPGFDNSADPAVAARAIDEAVRTGIDFFALDWWPVNSARSFDSHGSSVNDDVDDFLKAPNLSRIKFCMFYETWTLGFNAANQTTLIDPEMELQFDVDMVHFAEQYFNNPSYLRIDGRPVVFLYLTRTLVGDVAGMMAGARKVLAERGYRAFFVGDEVYWNVTKEDSAPGPQPLTTVPQVDRIRQFDAITGYSLYDGPPAALPGPTVDFTGYPGTTHIVADERALYAWYRATTDDQVPVIPDVTPGYNDRATRLPTNHPAQPRQWLPGAGPASTLDELFRQVAVPSLDPKLPMIMVTAWNEWNEDSGVQPIGGVPTPRDDSPSGTVYTQGYTYGGEGDADLVVLRHDIAVADRELARRG